MHLQHVTLQIPACIWQLSMILNLSKTIQNIKVNMSIFLPAHSVQKKKGWLPHEHHRQEGEKRVT